jgi:pyruvate dehydrogenase E1 component beta subunit
MAVPGLKVVAPSTPRDVIGLLAGAVRDPDPVLFFEQKSLYALKGEVEDGEIVEELGRATVRREGNDVSIVALAAMVPVAIEAAQVLESEGVSAEVIDLRSLVPLDVSTVAASVIKTAHLVTVEENPRLCGWGAELSSIVAEELIYNLDGPIVRVTTPHVPLPAADSLEDAALPSPARVVAGVRRSLG